MVSHMFFCRYMQSYIKAACVQRLFRKCARPFMSSSAGRAKEKLP